MSSRSARTTWRNPISEKKRKEKKKTESQILIETFRLWGAELSFEHYEEDWIIIILAGQKEMESKSLRESCPGAPPDGQKMKMAG